MKKLLIVTGELSGSIYGEKLAGELSPHLKIYGVFCRDVKGVKRIYDSKKIAVFGLFEVLKKLPEIARAKRRIGEFLSKEKPDAVLLIDFPGFNLQIAREAKKRGIKVFYFIPPKLWAWGERRINKIKSVVDKLFVIFPFEVEFYRERGVEAVYVGNPLVDLVKPSSEREEFFSRWGFSVEKPLIALMPGSRKSEVEKLFPLMKEVVERLFPNFQFGLAVASSIGERWFKKEGGNGRIRLIPEEERYDLLYYATSGIIASGTASLEAALAGLPHVVVYKVNPLTFYIAKKVVRLSRISLPNIIAGDEVVPELLQGEANAERVVEALEALLFKKEKLRKELNEKVKSKLEGGAVRKLSEEILKELEA